MLTQKDFLLTISYSRNTTKVICFLLVILSAVQSHIVKRASTCNTETPPDIMYCSPIEGEVHKIGQDVVLSWNPVNNLFFGTDIEKQVEVYLFRKRQNVSGIEDAVMLNPENSTDYIVVPIIEIYMNITVESRWLPKFKYSTPSDNERHTFLFRVIPKGSNNKSNRVFSSPYFIVLGPVQSNSTTDGVMTKSQATPTIPTIPTIVSGTSSINSETPKKNKSENNAFIAVSSIAIFLALIAIVVAIRNRKRANNKTMHQSLSNLSATSSTPIMTSLSIGKFEGNNRDLESTAEGESIHSTTQLANKEEMRSKPKSTVSFSSENQPISASDAAFLSDAFRKVLRKPDWKPEDDEDDDTNLSQEERLRREAKELMKKELAEEGTDLQNISRRHTKVEIRNTSDELEKDGASCSSESGSK